MLVMTRTDFHKSMHVITYGAFITDKVLYMILTILLVYSFLVYISILFCKIRTTFALHQSVHTSTVSKVSLKLEIAAWL